jgi:YggT family protein
MMVTGTALNALCVEQQQPPTTPSWRPLFSNLLQIWFPDDSKPDLNVEHRHLFPFLPPSLSTRVIVDRSSLNSVIVALSGSEDRDGNIFVIDFRDPSEGDDSTHHNEEETRSTLRFNINPITKPKRTMRSPAVICAILAACLASCDASVFLPKQMQVQNAPHSFAASASTTQSTKNSLRSTLSQRRTATGSSAAMAIPGYGVAEQVFVGGFGTFLSIYNIVITARVLLSWFPQAQEVAVLQPVFAITDPYLNLFRGIIPPVYGLDLSPLAAFFLLSVMTKATVAVGCDTIDHMKETSFTKNKSVFGRKPNVLQRQISNNGGNKKTSSLDL